MNTKICTSPEQSKKLVELGIDINTADMIHNILGESYVRNDTPIDEYHTPAWSLNALLEVMPQSITIYNNIERCQKTYHINCFRSYYHCVSYSFGPSTREDDGSNTLFCIGRDNWVDACCEMICRLKENNKI